MSIFNMGASIAAAEGRFSVVPRASRRARRSDVGGSRLPPPVLQHLDGLLLGQERPPLDEVRAGLAAFCRRQGYRCPSRATLYKLLSRVPGHCYAVAGLPAEVRATLYNLADDGTVPGRQLAFYCFNYGGLAALSYAAGLPWLDLYQAARMRGFRPKSHALLRAVLQLRGIESAAAWPGGEGKRGGEQCLRQPIVPLT